MGTSTSVCPHVRTHVVLGRAHSRSNCLNERAIENQSKRLQSFQSVGAQISASYCYLNPLVPLPRHGPHVSKLRRSRKSPCEFSHGLPDIRSFFTLSWQCGIWRKVTYACPVELRQMKQKGKDTIQRHINGDMISATRLPNVEHVCRFRNVKAYPTKVASVSCNATRWGNVLGLLLECAS